MSANGVAQQSDPLSQPAMPAAPHQDAPHKTGHGRQPSLRRVQDSREQLHRRKSSKASKPTFGQRQETPASRGRDFRVGNVGNNGLIYLRPVQRPPHVPAQASVSTATSAVPTSLDSTDFQWRSSVASGTNTRHSILSTSSPRGPKSPINATPNHRHARSASKNEYGSRAPPPARGAFKVIIDRASQSQAPSTAKTLDTLSIPHYRLGTPRFTDKGSAILNSSINSSQRDNASPDGARDEAGHSHPGHDLHTGGYEHVRPAGREQESPTLKRTLHRVQVKDHDYQGQSQPGSHLQGHKLPPHPPSAVQADQSPSEIRISAATGQLLAASIPQLIAQITSPKLLDYELLSDFFLTYRLFMTPGDLASMLIERLKVSLRSSDEYSRVVRVRTFVALRHWILNYFVDDFVSDFDLRARFCVLVNRLCQSLERTSPERVGDLRILEELKKCWRHTCALFWDIPLAPSAGPHEDIQPGGYLGSREAALDWDEGGAASSGSHIDLQYEERPQEPSPASSYSEPEFAFNQTHKLGSETLSSSSSFDGVPGNERQSIQVLSCSIPATVLGSKHQRDPSFGPRPIPSFSKGQKQPTQPPSSAGNAKKHHSRSGSLSDALRDERGTASAPAPSVEADSQPPGPMVIPGSLIRGATVAPGMPYVEFILPASPPPESAQPDCQTPPSTAGSSEQRGRQFQSPNPGMRRFIGTVRRALSAKNTGTRAPSQSPVRGRDEKKMPNSPASAKREPSAQKRKLIDGKAMLRIDMLAAEVQEAFKTAVQQVREAQEALHSQSAVHVEPPTAALPDHENNMPLLQVPTREKWASVTTGSRSIVIMDDTNGQLTPKADLPPPTRPWQVGSQVSSMDPRGPGVQSVPVFLDTATAEPTETLEDETQLYSETSTETYEWPSEDRNDTIDDASQRQSESLQAPKPNAVAAGAAPVEGRAVNGQKVSPDNSFEAATTITEDTQTSTTDPFHLERIPARQLRRLPAGNLRAANHVHSLDEHSQATYSQAMDNLLHAPPSIPPRVSSSNAKELQAPYSVAVTTEKSDTVSRTSQPAMRPSFEREVAKLAQLPDSPANDNGIESALAKLEGRGEASPSEPPPDFVAAMRQNGQSQQPGASESAAVTDDLRNAKRLRREDEVVELTDGDTQEDFSSHGAPHVVVQAKPVSLTNSSVSHSSIPLLQRGASQPPGRQATLSDNDDAMLSHRPGSRETSYKVGESVQTGETMPGSEESYELIEEDDSLRRARAGKKPAKDPKAHQSFLLNEHETLSELSSLTPDDFSDVAGGKSPGMKSFFEEDDQSVAPNDDDVNTPRRRSKPTSVIPRPQNPTPESPTDRYQVDPAYVPGAQYNARESPTLGGYGLRRSSEEPYANQARASPLSHAPSSAHLSFILAYDSAVLAQQLTLIERDALCEIDWRDLIDLRWNQIATAYYNWVDYLRANGATDPYGNPVMRPGVDMCIARFNLMVRWVKSQVVLTREVAERVSTIVKFIHIAQHARRLRNWATMYQISMALVSADMSRLKQTWSLVPEEERDALAQLEDLIMPKRNFHNLRVEIENASNTWTQESAGGCIPFIGIYTHDLIYNAQKPPKVRINARGAMVDAANPDADANKRADRPVLVNFERHHTAATIVKNLLRLIEASSKYAFQPEEEITSRCLWIGALHDAEVTRRSKELEPFERSSA